MRQSAVDRWAGISFMALAALWCWFVESTVAPAGIEGAPGPRAFPILLGESLFVLGGVMTALSLTPLAPTATVEPARRDELTTVAEGAALFLAYAFLLDKLGFLLATPIVVVLALRVVLRLRGWFSIVTAAALLTLGCELVFGIVLQANLPQGEWLSFVASWSSHG